MQEILQRISAKKAILDSLSPFPPELEKNMYEWFKVTLTYSSNAIEGNTLTLAETAQVIEKHTTIGGKSINEHLEAINHANAIDFIRDLAHTKKREQLNLDDILAIHKIVLHSINDDWAGKLSLQNAHNHVATIAAQAHLQLIAIHPFVDGNGRTARLLFNLLLLQQNYPLVIINVKDRAMYIKNIQKALEGKPDDHYNFMYVTIEYSLDEYLKAAEESGIKLL